MNLISPSPEHPLPFVDLGAQRRRLEGRIDAAMMRVVEHGQFIMGPEVFELEQRLSDFCGAKHTITCSSGTDALLLVLVALGVGEGDGVICPSFTFCATAEVVAALGATPVFADVDPRTYNLSVESSIDAIAVAKQAGLRPVGLIPVDLFGLPASYDAIGAVAAEHDLWILSDAAQSLGANFQGQKVGKFGIATATSFFPAKPLGCYGDGGAVFTDDDELASLLKSLRVHGQGEHKYDNIRIGMAARMDTLQAAVLLEKLAIFPEEISARDEIAGRYDAQLTGVCETPARVQHSRSVWAQYTVKVSPHARDGVRAELKSTGIPTQVYYPLPLHQQKAYAVFPRAASGLTNSENLSQSVLSLPMHPYLSPGQQEAIASNLRAAITKFDAV